MKYNTKQDVIKKAQEKGSKSTTFKGAKSYLIKNTRSFLHNEYYFISSFDRGKNHLKNWNDIKLTKKALLIAKANNLPTFEQMIIPDYTICRKIELMALYYNRNANKRLKKISCGDNKENPTKARMNETDNGKTGWNKVVNRYCNYFCRMHNNWIYYAFGDSKIYKSQYIPGIKACIIAGEKIFLDDAIEKYKMPLHIVKKAMELYLPKIGNLTIEYDNNKNLVLKDFYGEEYHINNNLNKINYYGSLNKCFKSTIKELIKIAVHAFRNRRKEAKEKALREKCLEIAKNRRVYVSLQDSYKSGNCVTMSNNFAREFLKALDQPVTHDIDIAWLASDILAIRDDSYTQRACVQSVKDNYAYML